MAATEQAQRTEPEPFDKGLRHGVLGLLSSTVIGIASTAPAYSLAATLGFVVVIVGVHSPAIMLVAFVPMLFTAIAYQELNKADPDCGTTFTWAWRAFGPRTGWIGGWAIVAADVIVMANLAQIAGQYGFLLFNAHGLAASTAWTTVVGVAWIVAMTWICYIGIEISAKVQYGLLAIEIVILGAFSAVALTKTYTGHPGSIHPALSWFNPFGVGSFRAFADGCLLAVFIYWGWDTAVAVNEESRDRDTVPGRAAVLSTFVLLAIYALVTTAAQAFAGVGSKGIGLGNSNNSGDVLSVLGKAVFGTSAVGTLFSHLLLFLVLTSAAASTLTTILPTARTTLAMAAHRALPERFARIHRRYLTPTWSTIGMGLVSIAFYVVLTKASSNVLGDSIASLTLIVVFYYGLTGFTCVWHYRRTLIRSSRDFFMRGLLPFLGGVILWGFMAKAIVDYAKPDFGSTSWTLPFPPHWHVGGVLLTGLGAMLLGAVLMVIYNGVRPAFFRGEILTPADPPGPVKP